MSGDNPAPYLIFAEAGEIAYRRNLAQTGGAATDSEIDAIGATAAALSHLVAELPRDLSGKVLGAMVGVAREATDAAAS